MLLSFTRPLQDRFYLISEVLEDPKYSEGFTWMERRSRCGKYGQV